VVSSITGSAATTYIPAVAAFTATVNWINAHHGVNGHQITTFVQDDAGLVPQNLSAVQSLVQNRGALLIVDLSRAEAGGADWASQQGIPVLDGGFSIVSSTDSAVFSRIGGDNPDPSLGNTTLATFFKSIGVHNVGALAGSTCAACGLGAQGTLNSAALVGLNKGYINTTIPSGNTNWTPYVLGMQNSSTDAVSLGLDLNNSLSFIATEKQQGLNLKVLSGALFVPSLLADSTTNYIMQGVYATVPTNPIVTSAPVKTMIRILKNYGDAANVNPPGTNEDFGYITALLLQEALSVGGTNPTRPGIIAGLNHVKAWDPGGGMMGYKINFSLEHTSAAPVLQGPCLWVLQARGSNFVPVSKKPICTPTVRVITG
jgi:branched-chain amino acid transport system substrate-binding protein